MRATTGALRGSARGRPGLFDGASRGNDIGVRAFALSELIRATGGRPDRPPVAMEQDILANIEHAAWPLASILPQSATRLHAGSTPPSHLSGERSSAAHDSPYGVPYSPDIWGAGWTIQELGVRQYFFHKGWPQHRRRRAGSTRSTSCSAPIPGENNMSFVSGVGANSPTIAYGTNRADWSYIPGGVISGTALIRPDLPELKEWPFFWQQTEYVIGGGEANFMFLALAADRLYAGGGSR